MNARAFVEKHGIVLVSARHATVPSLAAAIAGEAAASFRGSWWAHPKSHEIFRALAALDDDEDVVFTKLVDGKLTIVHRRLWPALAALVRAKKLDAARLTKIEQEHTTSGKHVNHETPLDEWLPKKLKLPSVDEALSQLGEPLAASLLRRGGAAPRSPASAGRAARARRR
jgi:hypothetical protein